MLYLEILYGIVLEYWQGQKSKQESLWIYKNIL